MKIFFNSQQSDKKHSHIVLLAFEEDLKSAQCSYINTQDLDFSGEWLSTQKISILYEKQLQHVLLVGLGSRDEIQKRQHELIGDKIYAQLHEHKSPVHVTFCDRTLIDGHMAARIAFGIVLKSWVFEKHITQRKTKHHLQEVHFHASDDAETAFQPLANIANGVHLTREIGCEPSSIMTPTAFVARAIEELQPLGVSIKVLEQNDMQKLGMNAVIAVAQGSMQAPKFLVLEWNGNKTSDAFIAFVGKGVTFDSGGISIKPSDHMDDMKYDMSGAGTVLGLAKAVALNKLAVNIVCAMPLVENMPSGSAVKPGDIVQSMSGQTIEILNTDAEGRLILADALWYVQEKYNTEYIIDLATLTGAIVVALGSEIAGLFSNDDHLAQSLMQASKTTNERLWRMPLLEYYDKCMDSKVADIKNIGSPLARCGSITAAQFLQRFVNKKKWAHIDIAGVADASREKDFSYAGATAFGVRLLYAFLEQQL